MRQRLAPAGVVVARVGEAGCWLAIPNGLPQHVAARPTEVRDTTGVGDASVAALLAWLARGESIERAASVVNVAASPAIEREGPATGPTEAELQEALMSSQ